MPREREGKGGGVPFRADDEIKLCAGLTLRSLKLCTIFATAGPPPGPILRAATPACWAILEAPEVLWLWMVAAAAAYGLGPAMYPSRQPVIANALEKPLTTRVLSHMPAGAF